MRSIVSCVFASILVAACSASNGPSLDPARSNCSVVCQKSHDCVSSGSNVDACTDSCANKSNDTSYKDKVTECSDCVAPKACSDAAKCTGDCFSLVVSS